MNLTTKYLGLTLQNPLVIGASPYCDTAYVARQLQDAGAAAIVMRSLFEEQIIAEQRALVHHLESSADSSAEASSYFPAFSEYQLTPDHYLKQLEHLKKTLSIPVIGSLNGSRPGGWTEYAKRIADAGADALELNLYQLVTDPTQKAAQIEAGMVETVRSVTSTVKIPVAVKISSFHTSLANFVLELEGAGASGVVLFNRFYQPDFNLEDLEVLPQLKLSDNSELLLRLRWLAIVSPHVKGSLSASGGVHSPEDAVKAVLAGAHTVQIVSALLKHGPRFITTLLNGMEHWLTEHGYESVEQLCGAMNHRRCPDPSAFERANYIRILQSWRV
ncbi:dihydroorotate dehydrogenase-like protein [Opitutus sp. ER46]|uniref:dihydroorotate dehydrogenase-like protein n=1 Tax=Opitutus sp. ER46 TaxID=2161864 RepID=UPI000D2F5857|nr:dihydroorotate dehydrogenase-like protein [Opitutus sp. ER46]PTX92721.1 dihydroorotate dehydrogenase-like protein [Opitutus sp. ER46]